MTRLKVGKIQIGDLTARVYRNPETNVYYYSIRSIAELIGIHHKTVLNFIGCTTFKDLLDEVSKRQKSEKLKNGLCESLEPLQANGSTMESPIVCEGNFIQNYPVSSGSNITAFSCELATEVIIHFAMKGYGRANDVLRMLTRESLQTRALRAFDEDSQENVRKLQDENDERLATKYRLEARSRHMAWQKACYQCGLNPTQAHESITLVIWGQTAKEARLLPLTGYEDNVWKDAKIGINHHPEHEKMETYKILKDRLVSYKKGTLKERLERAIKDLNL